MTMLRRRRKGPKAERLPHGAGPRTRRRSRPEAPVPPELVITPEALAAGKQAPEQAAKEAVRPSADDARPKEGERPRPDEARRERGSPPDGPPAKRRDRPGRTPAVEPAPERPDAQPQQGATAAPTEEVVLVTGFEPFGGEASNPSWEICRRLPREIDGLRVEVCRVPCEFRRAIEVVAATIERHRPAIVISLGQAGGRTHLSVERVAINVDDARIPDNAGASPVHEPIAAQGPPAYFATVPVKAMVAGMRRAGVPAELSNSAGTYVCNHLMYGVLHFLAASGNGARAGFVHVPYAEEQVLERPGTPSMSLASMARGVEAAIAAARRAESDLDVAEGRTD